MLYYQNDQITIYNDSVLAIDSIPAGSVDLIVTSPPYNVSIDYNSHADDSTYEEYLAFSEQWMRRCYDWLKDDGRFCLNIPLDKNKGGQRTRWGRFHPTCSVNRLPISRHHHLE
jgi:site-specific DNA-methyltransferase (adenine-specific)